MLPIPAALSLIGLCSQLLCKGLAGLIFTINLILVLCMSRIVSIVCCVVSVSAVCAVPRTQRDYTT